MPAIFAASPCSQAAAQAASNASIPCASRPAIIPVSTSPAPAVASQGGALALIAAFPSGAAITVSVPLRSTTQPALRAAARAAASFEGSVFSKPGNIRSNSPACGVSTHWARNCENNPLALSSKEVSASASRTTAASLPRVAATRSCVRSPTPQPGPIATALSRLSAKSALKPMAPSNGFTMIAVRWAALTPTASIGLATLTRPAPTRRAPRAPSLAAPVACAGPLTTTACPRAYL